MPAAARALTAGTPAVSANGRSALASVFRRCMNIVFTIRSKVASSASGTTLGLNVNRTTAEWTFGAGLNAPGGSVRTLVTSACVAAKIVRTP
jgi:hypothetical protein